MCRRLQRLAVGATTFACQSKALFDLDPSIHFISLACVADRCKARRHNACSCSAGVVLQMCACARASYDCH